MDIEIMTGAEAELDRLMAEHPHEGRAMQNAIEKLEIFGDRLPFPHSSNVQNIKGAEKLRELRPRAGRSPWRAFYRRIGNVIVIGSIGPDAEADHRGFVRAVVDAERRLTEIEQARKRP